jgi:hypothetical protein
MSRGVNVTWPFELPLAFAVGLAWWAWPPDPVLAAYAGAFAALVGRALGQG